MNRHCAYCRHARRTGSQWLECRRASPVTDPRPEGQRLGGVFAPVWPMVSDIDWCGDFEAAKGATGGETNPVAVAGR